MDAQKTEVFAALKTQNPSRDETSIMTLVLFDHLVLFPPTGDVGIYENNYFNSNNNPQS